MGRCLTSKFRVKKSAMIIAYLVLFSSKACTSKSLLDYTKRVISEVPHRQILTFMDSMAGVGSLVSMCLVPSHLIIKDCL